MQNKYSITRGVGRGGGLRGCFSPPPTKKRKREEKRGERKREKNEEKRGTKRERKLNQSFQEHAVMGL